MFYALLEKQTNKQKKPPRKAVLFHEYQASTGRSNKFLSLLAASVFFMITASGRACVFVCMSFYYRPPIRKCASWYCWRCFQKHTFTRCSVCVYQLRPSIKEAQQLQVHLETQQHKCEAWLCFSSKLEECKKSCVSPLFYGSKLWRYCYSNLPESLSGAHWPTCVCVCVCVRAHSSFIRL